MLIEQRKLIAEKIEELTSVLTRLDNKVLLYDKIIDEKLTDD